MVVNLVKFFIVLLGTGLVESAKLPTNATITELRKALLPKVPKTSIIWDLVKHDLYLAKWLDSSSWNVNKATEKVLAHIRWREAEGIDKLNYGPSNCSQMEADYPLFMGMEDKMRRPIVELWISDWNLRRAIITGKQRELTAWLQRMVELQQRHLYAARVQGSKATEAVMIMDIKGFNLYTLGCSHCLQVLSYWSQDWSKNYPKLFKKVFVINATPAAQIFITMLRAALGQEVEMLQLFNGPRTWRAYFDKIIDKNMRSERLGGNLKRDICK